MIIALDERDGWIFGRRTEIQANDRNIKIIFLTVKDSDVEIAKGMALGANAYITKPFSNATLVAKVKEILEKTYEEARE